MSQPNSPTTPAGVDEWRQDIEELRSLINESYSEPHPYATDYNLYRWLRAWRRDVDVILPLIRAHLVMREVLNMDSKEEFGKFPECTQIEPALAVLKPAYGFNKIDTKATDRDGNLLGIIKIGKINLQGILENTRNSDYILSNFIFAEQIRRELHALETAFGQPMGCTIIYDLQDLKLGKALLDAIQGGSGNVTRLVQSHFPELTRRILVINVPPAIDYIWMALKVFLAERTKKKVVFLGSDWRQSIQQFVDLKHLPEDYGGSSEKSCPDPIDIPGDEDIYSIPPQPDLKLIYIKPKVAASVGIPVLAETGSKLAWFFRANGELSFAIESLDESTNIWKPIIPKFPLNSSFHPEFGVVELESEVEHRLTFQNDSSLMFSTKLEYSIQIMDSDEQVVSQIEFQGSDNSNSSSSSYLPAFLTRNKSCS